MAGESAYEGFRRQREPATPEWFDRGDREALQLLYERYAPRLHAFCLRRLGNATDADDAVQDTFLKAQQALHRFDRSAPVWPWLVTIAAHACTDIHRLRAYAAERMPQAEPVLEPDEVVARRARTTIVDDALRSMPDRYRTSIYLKHFEGASYDDIARMQGTSIASVRTVLMRGRRQLGDRIEALARADRQWPLPSSVSLVARRVRDRARGWCRDCGRTFQGAVSAVDAVVSLHAVYAHAPAALVAFGALLTAVAVGDSEAVRPRAAASPPGRVADGAAPSDPVLVVGDRRAGPGAGAGIVVGSQAPASPFFTFAVPTPALAPDGPIRPTRAAAADSDDGSMELYVEVLGYPTTIWTDCTEAVYERVGCLAARSTLGLVEEHESTTPGVVDVGA